MRMANRFLILALATLGLSGCSLYEFKGNLVVKGDSLKLGEVVLNEGYYKDTKLKVNKDDGKIVAEIKINSIKVKLPLSVASELVTNQGYQTILAQESGLDYNIEYNLRHETYKSAPEQYCDDYRDTICSSRAVHVYDQAYLNINFKDKVTGEVVATYAGNDIRDYVEVVN